MFDNSPSDRMKLAGLGDLVHPAACMVCGNGNCEDGYVNTGVYFDYEGTMYLCRTCTIQAAEIFNCLTPEEAKVLEDLVRETALTNEKLTKALEVADERLQNYRAIIRDFGDFPDPDADASGVLTDKINENSESVDSNDVERSNARKSETSESTDGQDNQRRSALESVDITASGSGPRL